MKAAGNRLRTAKRAVRAGAACVLLAGLWAGCGSEEGPVAPPTVPAPFESASVTDPGAAGLEPSPSRIPCDGAGIEIEEFTPSDSILTASLAFDVPDASTGVSLDWVGPYLDLDPTRGSTSLPFLEIVVMEWTTTPKAGATRHLMKIGWPPFREAHLRVRSAGTKCESFITCSKEGCEVTS